jgi:hypothetical protein
MELCTPLQRCACLQPCAHMHDPSLHTCHVGVSCFAMNAIIVLALNMHLLGACTYSLQRQATTLSSGQPRQAAGPTTSTRTLLACTGWSLASAT